MNTLMKRYAPVVGLLMLVLSVLACNLDLDKDKNIIYVTSTAGPSNSDVLFSLTGTGTDTWNWKESGLSCNTQDEMTLTVNKAYDAKLVSRGACFYARLAESSPCNAYESDLPCGLVLLGSYNPKDSTITWDSCNGPTGNGEGTATVSGEVNGGVNIQVSGSGVCSFDNIDEWHRLDFVLTDVKPVPTP